MGEKKLSFEAAMQRLEQIFQVMESGDIPLEESLKLFREGTELLEFCSKTLDTAEMEIQKVVMRPSAPAFEDFADED